MLSGQYKNSNEETRTESDKPDHHLCFRQVNVRTLRNRNRLQNDDQDSAHQEKSCHVPSSLPSSSQCPETWNTGPIPSSDTEPSQSSAITRQPAYVDPSLEGEADAGKINLAARSNDTPLSSLRSPEEDIRYPEDDCNDYLGGPGSSRLTCWICHECDDEDPLVSPCSCSGTMGFVHVYCLVHWVNDMNVDYCEICGQRFHMAAPPKSARRFFLYVWQSEGRLRRALLSDLFYLAVAASAIVLSLVMLVAALGRIQSKGVVWQIAILVFLSSAFLTYCLECSFQRLRCQYHLFSTWHFANPARRFETEPSARDVSVGQTERIDVRAAGEPSTSGGRRRR
nr:E3 ubiquitin-protein ligase MARCHF3-like [Dermacentor andersoni]